jgi:4'-phosphopantetheinyl transferase
MSADSNRLVPEMGLIGLSWPLPAANFELDRGEIHVWSASLDRPASDYLQFAEMLSDDERQRLKTFYFDRDQRYFIARRGLLRTILGHYLNAEPRRLSFEYEARGKPKLSGVATCHALHFNVTHSGGLALFAVGRESPLGVDVEHLRPLSEMDQIASRFFSTGENTILSAAKPEQKLETFFNIWTSKEAYLKATGEGISDALAQVEGFQKPLSPWFLHPLSPARGFSGTLATKGNGTKLTCWRWPEQANSQAFGETRVQ